MGEEEVRLTKAAYGWPPDAHFLVPEEVPAHFLAGIGTRGRQLREAWERLFADYKKRYPEPAREIEIMTRCQLPAGWDADIKPFPADAKGMATRVSSGKVLNQVAKNVPWLLGGSADLAPSTNTLLNFADVGSLRADNPGGRNLHFGIREHAMGAVASGVALCGLRPYTATFFVFSDYMRPSIRLAAIMGLPVLHIFTHDSIGVGEDGPTHQPIEQLAALRSIPGVIVLRPADANEVAEAYRVALASTNRPVALVLTRQNLPTLDRSQLAPASGLKRGGYVLADAADGKPQVILIATGSEVAVCLDARQVQGHAKEAIALGEESLRIAEKAFGGEGVKSLRLDGPEATEANVKARIEGRRIVHLACHGLVDQAYGNLFGALALTAGPNRADPADDGFLTLAEIYRLNLAGTELAILSACDTNYGPQQRGEGVWTLSRGFLVAGARRVVASSWLVDDEAAATMISYFSGTLAPAEKSQKRNDYAAALQNAKRLIRQKEKWKDPFYWGSFVLVGPN